MLELHDSTIVFTILWRPGLIGTSPVLQVEWQGLSSVSNLDKRILSYNFDCYALEFVPNLYKVHIHQVKIGFKQEKAKVQTKLLSFHQTDTNMLSSTTMDPSDPSH